MELFVEKVNDLEYFCKEHKAFDSFLSTTKGLIALYLTLEYFLGITSKVETKPCYTLKVVFFIIKTLCKQHLQIIIFLITVTQPLNQENKNSHC